MAKGDVHVTWREDEAKWAVQKEGAGRASSLHDQKDAAEKAGRQNAINEHSELLILTARSRSAKPTEGISRGLLGRPFGTNPGA